MTCGVNTSREAIDDAGDINHETSSRDSDYFPPGWHHHPLFLLK